MNMSRAVAFTRPPKTGRELEYLRQAIAEGRLQGDGPFTRKVHEWLEQTLGCARALLTHSCTGALEMAALLADLQPGDEVIMPSFTFVSTGNAVALRGAVPVFVDIRPDTLNIDETLIEAAIGPRTKAIAPVHYAGVACAMDRIVEVAAAYGLTVMEDAAQGIHASFDGKPLGTIGQLGAFSFHETKNVVSGEGGALIVNDPALVERAEIIRQKGTNRSQFLRGETQKYYWVDIGSSYLPSELNAACLWAQLEQSESITARRRQLWQRYYDAFAELEEEGQVRRPGVPPRVAHNGHIFYLLLGDGRARDEAIAHLKQQGVHASAHFVPLHSSPGGRRFGRACGSLRQSEDLAARLLRLPLYADLSLEDQDYVIDCVLRLFPARLASRAN